MSVALPLPFYLSQALEWQGARVKRLKCVGMGLNQGNKDSERDGGSDSSMAVYVR